MTLIGHGTLQSKQCYNYLSFLEKPNPIPYGIFKVTLGPAWLHSNNYFVGQTSLISIWKLQQREQPDHDNVDNLGRMGLRKGDIDSFPGFQNLPKGWNKRISQPVEDISSVRFWHFLDNTLKITRHWCMELQKKNI